MDMYIRTSRRKTCSSASMTQTKSTSLTSDSRAGERYFPLTFFVPCSMQPERLVLILSVILPRVSMRARGSVEMMNGIFWYKSYSLEVEFPMIFHRYFVYESGYEVHKEFREDMRRAHDGTIEFTSRDGHMGALSRRSDLEVNINRYDSRIPLL